MLGNRGKLPPSGEPAWLQALKDARLPLYDVHWEPAVVLARSQDRKSGQGLQVGLGDGRVVPLTTWSAAERQAFAKNSWGGTFHKDFQVEVGAIVATEHWASSGFPNTDLEHQLKRYGKEKIICTGLLANTCVEATARIGMELGFHVTLVRDGTAARSHEALHAMLDIDGPTFAHEILTTTELVSAIRTSASAGEKSAGQASSKPF